jgi:hypothetical protein
VSEHRCTCETSPHCEVHPWRGLYASRLDADSVARSVARFEVTLETRVRCNRCRAEVISIAWGPPGCWPETTREAALHSIARVPAHHCEVVPVDAAAFDAPKTETGTRLGPPPMPRLAACEAWSEFTDDGRTRKLCGQCVRCVDAARLPK